MAVSSVSDTATSATLLEADSRRDGLSVFNDSTEILYLLQGIGTASATNFSVKLAAGDYFESPSPRWARKGASGVWANNASGAARITSW